MLSNEECIENCEAFVETSSFMAAAAVLKKMRITECPDKLIEAVKRRPVLYSRFHPQFTDRKLKQEMWYQVCAEITPNWGGLGRGAQGEVAQEVQRRWKTLRDGFSRELVFQKQDKMKRANGEYVRRRKIYTYYNPLKFLLKEKKQKRKRETSQDDDEEVDNSDSNQSEGSNTRDSSDGRDDDKMNPAFKIEPGTSAFYVDVENMNETKGFEPTNSFAGLDMDKTLDDDEDRLFCLSLVSGLKKMSEKQKYEAKIRIMKVISEVRFNNTESQTGLV